MTQMLELKIRLLKHKKRYRRCKKEQNQFFKCMR